MFWRRILRTLLVTDEYIGALARQVCELRRRSGCSVGDELVSVRGVIQRDCTLNLPLSIDARQINLTARALYGDRLNCFGALLAEWAPLHLHLVHY